LGWSLTYPSHWALKIYAGSPAFQISSLGMIVSNVPVRYGNPKCHKRCPSVPNDLARLPSTAVALQLDATATPVYMPRYPKTSTRFPLDLSRMSAAPSSQVKEARFSVKKLAMKIRGFRRWMLEAFIGKQASAADKAGLRATIHSLARIRG
jgi:hypothetical protein